MAGGWVWPNFVGVARVYTLREAAEVSTVGHRALRGRVDRGQLRTVLRSGRRLIPHSELVRAGLLKEQHSEHSEVVVVRELVEQQLERQAVELARLKVLPERLELYQQRIEEVGRTRDRALAEGAVMCVALSALASAGFLKRRKLRERLRQFA